MMFLLPVTFVHCSNLVIHRYQTEETQHHVNTHSKPAPWNQLQYFSTISFFTNSEKDLQVLHQVSIFYWNATPIFTLVSAHFLSSSVFTAEYSFFVLMGGGEGNVYLSGAFATVVITLLFTNFSC